MLKSECGREKILQRVFFEYEKVKTFHTQKSYNNYFKVIFAIKHINIIKLFTKTNIYEIIFFYQKN
jgi:hypothetical protein